MPATKQVLGEYLFNGTERIRELAFPRQGLQTARQTCSERTELSFNHTPRLVGSQTVGSSGTPPGQSHPAAGQTAGAPPCSGAGVLKASAGKLGIQVPPAPAGPD